jgi:dolichol-phosphate mannosyltransferase
MIPTTDSPRSPALLSIVVPCFNEEKTLEQSIGRLREIADPKLRLEIIIVDDCSRDRSAAIAGRLAQQFAEVKLLRHSKNQGKGAALRTGFSHAGGAFVAIHDADLEYQPQDIKRMVALLIRDEADVVFGSRFLSPGAHRVLYFWHSIGNRLLTLLSNMFTDLNLTDMEVCYKVFKREIVQQIDIQENRFGFEPEIVAKIAHLRPRVFEMGISYFGRTYAEGKKIKLMDGLRALYCILRYNASTAPLGLQIAVYLCIGAIAAGVNLALFGALSATGMPLPASIPIAFYSAATVNYFLCIGILFRHGARWAAVSEVLFYIAFVSGVAVLDYVVTTNLIDAGFSEFSAKFLSTCLAVIINFTGRRFFIFYEPSRGPWKPIMAGNDSSEAERDVEE